MSSDRGKGKAFEPSISDKMSIFFSRFGKKRESQVSHPATSATHDEERPSRSSSVFSGGTETGTGTEEPPPLRPNVASSFSFFDRFRNNSKDRTSSESPFKPVPQTLTAPPTPPPLVGCAVAPGCALRATVASFSGEEKSRHRLLVAVGGLVGRRPLGRVVVAVAPPSTEVTLDDVMQRLEKFQQNEEDSRRQRVRHRLLDFYSRYDPLRTPSEEDLLTLLESRIPETVLFQHLHNRYGLSSGSVSLAGSPGSPRRGIAQVPKQELADEIAGWDPAWTKILNPFGPHVEFEPIAWNSNSTSNSPTGRFRPLAATSSEFSSQVFFFAGSRCVMHHQREEVEVFPMDSQLVLPEGAEALATMCEALMVPPHVCPKNHCRWGRLSDAKKRSPSRGVKEYTDDDDENDDDDAVSVSSSVANRPLNEFELPVTRYINEGI